MASSASSSVLSLAELNALHDEPHIFDFAEIQKLHTAMEYHGDAAPRLGNGHEAFFDPINRGALFPLNQDPSFNPHPSRSQPGECRLHRKRNYLRAMFGQCAPSAITYHGEDACEGCRATKGRRYADCRRAFDGRGNAIVGGACMNCDSLSHGIDCTFHPSHPQHRPPQDTASQADVPSNALNDASELEPVTRASNQHDLDRQLATPDQMAVGQAISDPGNPREAVSLDLDFFYDLSTTKGFDLTVEVGIPFLVLDIITQQAVQATKGQVLRIGVLIPGTDWYQIQAAESEHFSLKADHQSLRTKVWPTGDTINYGAQPEGAFVPSKHYHIDSLIQVIKTITLRNLMGEKITIPAGNRVHQAETRHLPGCVVLSLVVQTGELKSSRAVFPLPGSTMQELLDTGALAHVGGAEQLDFNRRLDLLDGEIVAKTQMVSNADILACGSQLEPVQLGQGEEIYVLVTGGRLGLTWGRTREGQYFVHL